MKICCSEFWICSEFVTQKPMWYNDIGITLDGLLSVVITKMRKCYLLCCWHLHNETKAINLANLPFPTTQKIFQKGHLFEQNILSFPFLSTNKFFAILKFMNFSVFLSKLWPVRLCCTTLRETKMCLYDCQNESLHKQIYQFNKIRGSWWLVTDYFKFCCCHSEFNEGSFTHLFNIMVLKFPCSLPFQKPSSTNYLSFLVFICVEEGYLLSVGRIATLLLRICGCKSTDNYWP